MIYELNPLTFLYDFFYYLANLANGLWSFLWNDVTIGNFTFKPIAAIGATVGVTVVTIIIVKLIKEIVPLL